MMRPLVALASLAALGSAAPIDEPRRFSLTGNLEEISGLAVAGPTSVFAHNDEHAIVYEISLVNGRVRRAFALGDPTLEGDFEGIASVGRRVFLVTSDGLIYAAQIGRHRHRVAYTVHDTGIGPRCEIEGLSRSPVPDELLLLCKRSRRDNIGEGGRSLAVYRWKIDHEHASKTPFMERRLRDLLNADERPDFRPSGIEWDPATRHIHIVSGRNHLLLTFDQNGRLLRKRRLEARAHPKTEGLALINGQWLALADEGSPTRRGRVTVYPTD